MVSAVPPPINDAVVDAGGAVRGYFRNIYRSVTSIIEGLSVTMSWMFRRPMTIQYPDKMEKPVQEMLPEGYRGILEVDIRLCTGCGLCEKICPIGCIVTSIEKNVEGVRELKQFDIDIAKCMFCGLCVESCAFDALKHTNEFEACMPRIDQLTLRFVEQPVKVAKGKGKSPPRAKPGEILRGILAGYGRRPLSPRFVAPPFAPPPETERKKPREKGGAADPDKPGKEEVSS